MKSILLIIVLLSVFSATVNADTRKHGSLKANAELYEKKAIKANKQRVKVALFRTKLAMIMVMGKK